MAKYSWPIDERINGVPLYYNYNSFEAGLRRKKEKKQKTKTKKPKRKIGED